MILLMLLVLAIRVDAAPVHDPIAEAVRYANILTGADPDAQIARRAPDDPDDQGAGTTSDDDDDDDDDDDEDDEDDDSDGDDHRRHVHDARGDRVRVERDRAEDARMHRDAAVGSLAAGEDDPALDVAVAEHAGELALLDDAAIASAATAGDDADLAASSAGTSETYEARMRNHRSWILGRLDVGLSWRRRLSAPMHAPAHLDHQVWLLATWRR